MIPITHASSGGCSEALFMRVKLDPAVVEYAVWWSWTKADTQWEFTSDGRQGSGPYSEEIWSTTALTPQNTGVNVHYKVPKGYGAWFVAAGGGSPPCEVKSGIAEGYAWIKN